VRLSSMAGKKLRVNVKSFLNDLRSGMDRGQLMENHGLDPKALDKLQSLLVKKELLDPSEVLLESTPMPTFEDDVGSYSGPIADPSGERQPTGSGAGIVGVNLTQCPQCGATVSERALICPECGHVLPGQERWEEAERKKTFSERIPPVVLGCLLAIPVAVILFFFLKDFMLPATESQIDKRIQAIRRETPKGKSPLEAAKDMANAASEQALKNRIQRLISQGIFSQVDEGYYVFATGPRWGQLSREEQVRYISGIQSAMRRSGFTAQFDVVSPEGVTVAMVKDKSIKFAGQQDGEDLGSIEEGVQETSPRPGQELDTARDALAPEFRRPRYPLKALPGR
jgi:hypothetical protein